MTVEINNLTKRKIDSGSLKKLARKVLKQERKKIDISIAFVGKEEIRKLNKKYLKKNKPTDVLSFLYEKEHLGEIIICPSQVSGELTRTLIHGILHLLEYNHGQKMFVKEKYYNHA